MILRLIVNMAWAEVDDSIVNADQQWWRSWEDPKLIELIEIGLQEAPDIEIALSRVVQAEQMSKQLRAGFLPSVSISTNLNMQPADALGFGFGLSSLDDLFPTDPNAPVEEEESSDIFASSTMALQMAVPLDIWGRQYSNHRASVIDAHASELDRVNGVRMFAASIANAYYDVLSLQQQQSIVTEQREITDTMLEIATMRHQRDDATVLDVLQQRQQQQTLQIQEVRIEQQVTLAEQRLEVLLGRSPTQTDGSFDTSTFPVFSVVDAESIDDVLNRRLDVQSAKARVQSAEKRRYAALTQMLPTLAVNGQLSRQANYRGDTGAEWNTLDAWSAGGAVNVTLFQGGSLWAGFQSADAALVIAQENLRKTQLQAEQEISQVLLQELQQQQIQSLTEAQLESARLAHQEAMVMYRKGVAPYLTVLSTQQALQQAELSNLQTQRDGVRIRLQTINALRVQATDL